MEEGRYGSAITTLAASQISIVAIAGINGANVQEALASLASRTVSASDVSITQIQNLTGNNVQAALADAAGKIQTNATTGIDLRNEITKVDAKIGALKATQVGFDNTTAAIPGNSVDTVQKAIEGVVSKFSGPNAVDASKVSFTSTAGIAATNVAEALDELKTEADVLDAIYIKRSGGQLDSNLDANNKKITKLAAPTEDADAVNKKYVDDAGAGYITKSNGRIDTDLDANNKKIVKLAAPTDNTDAVNKAYVDAQGGNYVTKQVCINRKFRRWQ